MTRPDPFSPGPDPEVRKSDHSLNKFSSPEEIIRLALVNHILRFYPGFNPFELTIMNLERVIRTLSTKAMETL